MSARPMKWIAVSAEVGAEDMEAFGPFSSAAAAEKFVQDYEEEGCRPAYPLVVLELTGVRDGQRMIREERAVNNREY